jgi:proline iminopeptidase
MSTSGLVGRPASDQEPVPVSREPVVADPRTRVLVAVAVPAAAAVLAAVLIPRGPVTTVEALASMGVAVAVGIAAGALMASRWSVVSTPAVFVVVYELVRIGAQGPTVDAPRLTVMGLVVALGVRAVLGLIMLAPMAVGARWGVELAARRGAEARRLGRGRLAGLSLLSLALVALAALIARPASTAPIVGADGQLLAGSIAELTTVTVGGHEQAVMIRGVSTDNPVLLHLAGGPGGTDVGAMRLDTGLEQHFVVVTWDQRGTGKSYGALEPLDTLSLESAITDTLGVTDHLRERFGQERIFITGQSWGTLPSVLAAQRHPERYHAVVGTGQMVDVTETDRIFYDDTLAWARARDDAELEGRLLGLGPPPYDGWTDYLTIVGYERDLFPYPEFDGHTEMPATIWGPENSVMDTIGALRGLADTYAWLYPQLQGLDLREVVPRLEVPLYVVMGEHEARGRVEPAREWFETLDAPRKEWVELPASSHRASFEQPDAYTRLLERVLSETHDS